MMSLQSFVAGNLGRFSSLGGYFPSGQFRTAAGIPGGMVIQQLPQTSALQAIHALSPAFTELFEDFVVRDSLADHGYVMSLDRQECRSLLGVAVVTEASCAVIL